jgi:hypothetical protein
VIPAGERYSTACAFDGLAPTAVAMSASTRDQARCIGVLHGE